MMRLAMRLLVGLWCAAALWGCAPGASDAAGEDATDKLFAVRRSRLIIGTLLRGVANAKETHRLYPEASYKNTLIWIEEENKFVKKGDVVIRFETEKLLDDIEQRKLNLELKQKSLDIKNEETRILKSENQSLLRVAADAVKSADEAFARYYKYDGKNERSGKAQAVVSKEEDWQAAKDEYQEGLNTFGNTIYDDEAARQKAREKLDKLESEMQSKERQYDAAVYAQRIFKKYTYPNTLAQKENKLIQARLHFEKIKVSTASRLVQKENEINKIKNELRKFRLEVERVEGYLPMMEIKAPVDGILVYGDARSTRNRQIEIELGMDVGRKRVIATIPEMQNLIVNFELPEQFLHRVKTGAQAFITPDALPSIKVSGTVEKIAVVPVHQISWDRTSPKVYRAVIALDEQDENFVSGMNVQVEVVEDTLEDVLNIPVEAVFEEEGEYYVYLLSGGKPNKQVVELGKSNDQYVHIVDGLDEGDRVYLYSPYDLGHAE